MRVLIVEDDRDLAERLAAALREGGLIAETVYDGREASFLGSTENYDAAVLDLGLPGEDGLSVLAQWRAQGCQFPVLILTGRGRWSDKLAGFNAGADDYLTKPFLLEEVVVRIRALLRRVRGGQADPVLRVGPLCFDTNTGRFALNDMPLILTAQEQRILAYLMHRQDKIVSRSEISEHVYERDMDPDSNTVDVLVGRIRKKLGVPLIVTERGQGFRLVAPPDDDGGKKSEA